MRRLVIALVLVAMTNGCSFFFVDGPKSGKYPDGTPRCTPSYAWPIFDSLYWGVPGLVGTVGAAAMSPSSENVPISRELLLGVSLGVLVLGASAAAYGAYKVGACKDSLVGPPP
jgi:hypothetical protein